MIDTNKYEGHSTEYSYEIVSVDDGKEMYATYALLNDAPLLLAEVKRLREDNKKLHDAINGCAYRGSEGSALDLYCESKVERCPTCDENVESGLCNEECEEE
jgi:hypothetical protein